MLITNIALFFKNLILRKSISNSPDTQSPKHMADNKLNTNTPSTEIHDHDIGQSRPLNIALNMPTTSVITEQQLTDAGLLNNSLDYKQLCKDLGSHYMEWSGILPRLQAFRKIQAINPAFTNQDFGILMRYWSEEEQTTWYENLNSDSNDKSQTCRKAFITMGQHWHFHQTVINTISHIDSQSLSSPTLFDQLQALSTLCTGTHPHGIEQKEMINIINNTLLSEELIEQIQNSWHNTEKLNEINDKLNSLSAT